MEDVLELYAEEFDASRPVVCFDETSKQLVRELRAAVPAKGGQVERFDYEYKRNGVANLFMMCQPKNGWRHVEVTDRHTKLDFAEQMKYLVDEAFPEAEKIRVVMDNLATHSRGAMYDRFAPSEASRILRKLEFHFTPKHASWLNMAEIELSVLARQCLSRRIADKEILKREVADWENKRNKEKCRINWKMTVDVARQKLIRHYPSISNGENTSNVLSIVLRHRVKYPLALGGASIKARHREINARFIEKLQPSADDGNAAPDTRCASIALARNRCVA